MARFSQGRRALAISDRSGVAFPYREMVQEWTGSWVHTSEFESKQPQLTPPYHAADAVALQHPRAQHKTGILVALGPQYWPGQFPPNCIQLYAILRYILMAWGKNVLILFLMMVTHSRNPNGNHIDTVYR